MNQNLVMKKVIPEDYRLLVPLMLELSDHHNKNTNYFKGMYPTYEPDDILDEFRAKTSSGEMALIAIYDLDINEIIGFSAVSSKEKEGSLDWLIVNGSYRGQGLGRKLMDWGLEELKRRNVASIDLNIVEGNPTKEFYEYYGFRTRMEVMTLRLE